MESSTWTGSDPIRNHQEGWHETPRPPCIEQSRVFLRTTTHYLKNLRQMPLCPQRVQLKQILLASTFTGSSLGVMHPTQRSLVLLKAKHPPTPPTPPPPKSVHLSQMNVLVEAVVCQALFFNLLQLLIAPLIFLPSRQSVLKKCDFRFCGWVGKLGFPGWRSVNPTACTSLGLKVFERTRTASWAQGGGCEGYSWGQRPWFTDPCSWVTVLEHKVPLVRILVIHKLPKSEGI